MEYECETCGRTFATQQGLKVHNQWERDDTGRRERASRKASEQNKGDSKFGKTSRKGTKNKRSYPKVTRTHSPEYLEKLRKQFREMNLARTNEEWQRIHQKGFETLLRRKETQDVDVRWSKSAWNSLCDIFDVETNGDIIG